MEKYNITKEASEDLYRIWDYTVETWSVKQADMYYAVLMSTLNKIASNPVKLGKNYDVILPGLKAYHIHRHMIFYTIQNDGRPVIARILHESMDYPRHFSL